jgi:hypothetical protein
MKQNKLKQNRLMWKMLDFTHTHTHTHTHTARTFNFPGKEEVRAGLTEMAAWGQAGSYRTKGRGQ